MDGEILDLSYLREGNCKEHFISTSRNTKYCLGFIKQIILEHIKIKFIAKEHFGLLLCKRMFLDRHIELTF